MSRLPGTQQDSRGQLRYALRAPLRASLRRSLKERMENTGRGLRITIGIFLPPFIGSILFYISIVISSSYVSYPIVTLPIYIIIGYVAMILPSIGYSAVMEIIVREWVSKPYFYFPSSAILGAVCGSLYTGFGDQEQKIHPLIIIGAFTGLSTAFVLRKLSPNSKSEPGEPGEVVNASAAAGKSENHLHD